MGKLVAESVVVPVIGIGARPAVDSRVLVTHDMVGIFDKFVSTFVQQNMQVPTHLLKTLKAYKEYVTFIQFPEPEY